jgi:hypothetical protein
MKHILFALPLIGLSLALDRPGPAPETGSGLEIQSQSRLQRATARAGFLVGHGNQEPGSVVFDVRKQGNAVSGEFQFAAEDHDHALKPYPATVLRLHAITHIEFDGSTVHIHGHGYLNDHHVHAEIVAYDGFADGKPDHFKMKCFEHGHLHYSIEREIRTGKIRVLP